MKIVLRGGSHNADIWLMKANARFCVYDDCAATRRCGFRVGCVNENVENVLRGRAWTYRHASRPFTRLPFPHEIRFRDFGFRVARKAWNPMYSLKGGSYENHHIMLSSSGVIGFPRSGCWNNKGFRVACDDQFVIATLRGGSWAFLSRELVVWRRGFVIGKVAHDTDGFRVACGSRGVWKAPRGGSWRNHTVMLPSFRLVGWSPSEIGAHIGYRIASEGCDE